jgi:hypothetical protein
MRAEATAEWPTNFLDKTKSSTAAKYVELQQGYQFSCMLLYKCTVLAMAIQQIYVNK